MALAGSHRGACCARRRYIIEAVEDFTEGSFTNTLHTSSGAGPRVVRAAQRQARGAGAESQGKLRKQQSGEQREFRSHVVLGLRIGRKWQSVQHPPPYVLSF